MVKRGPSPREWQAMQACPGFIDGDSWLPPFQVELRVQVGAAFKGSGPGGGPASPPHDPEG